MLQKLKVTTYVFILCLFVLTLMTVSPVFANSGEQLQKCKDKEGPRNKKNCFRDLSSEVIAELEELKDAICVAEPHIVHRTITRNAPPHIHVILLQL